MKRTRKRSSTSPQRKGANRRRQPRQEQHDDEVDFYEQVRRSWGVYMPEDRLGELFGYVDGVAGYGRDGVYGLTPQDVLDIEGIARRMERLAHKIIDDLRGRELSRSSRGLSPIVENGRGQVVAADDLDQVLHELGQVDAADLGRDR